MGLQLLQSLPATDMFSCLQRKATGEGQNESRRGGFRRGPRPSVKGQTVKIWWAVGAHSPCPGPSLCGPGAKAPRQHLGVTGSVRTVRAADMEPPSVSIPTDLQEFPFPY